MSLVQGPLCGDSSVPKDAHAPIPREHDEGVDPRYTPHTCESHASIICAVAIAGALALIAGRAGPFLQARCHMRRQMMAGGSGGCGPPTSAAGPGARLEGHVAPARGIVRAKQC